MSSTASRRMIGTTSIASTAAQRFEELDGVYLVGGGTHPGSGLPVIYESSRITSRLLLGDLGVSYGFIDKAALPLNALQPT